LTALETCIPSSLSAERIFSFLDFFAARGTRGSPCARHPTSTMQGRTGTGARAHGASCSWAFSPGNGRSICVGDAVSACFSVIRDSRTSRTWVEQRSKVS
jgi:hypothetical protein